MAGHSATIRQEPFLPKPAPDRKATVVMGIDPGSIICGYGVIERVDKTIRYVTSGDIRMPGHKGLPERLKRLFTGLMDILGTCHPDVAVVEKIFYAKGVTAALHLGHARGIALLCTALKDLPLVEYSPLEVKQAVTGYGKADKKQVQAMVKHILALPSELSPDSSDALALALCLANSMNFNENMSKGK